MILKRCEKELNYTVKTPYIWTLSKAEVAQR